MTHCGLETAKTFFLISAAIWNNNGDTVTLRDGNGTLIDDYSY